MYFNHIISVVVLVSHMTIILISTLSKHMNIHKHPWVNTKALRRANNGHLPIHIPYALGGPKIGHRPGPDYGSKVKKRPASASASGAAARGGSLSRRPPSATSTPPLMPGEGHVQIKIKIKIKIGRA